jgi:predicted  nucleic acid-binding Zn-ribbon protein
MERVMSTPSDIEKKSLEAHVEICAVRYTNLETKLDNLEQRMDKLEVYLVGIKESLEGRMEDRSKSVMGWTITIMGVLLSALLGYIGHGIFK